MTFLALFKRWCTAKSFCLMRSHFEKWQILRIVGLFLPESAHNMRHCVRFFFLKKIFLSIRGNTVFGECFAEMNDDIFSVIVGSSLEPCPLKSFAHFYELWDWSQDDPAALNSRIKDSLCAGWTDILSKTASSQCTYYRFLPLPSWMCCSCGLITPTAVSKRLPCGNG